MAIYSPAIGLAEQPTLHTYEVAAVGKYLFGAEVSRIPLNGGSNPDIFSMSGTLGRGVVKFFSQDSSQAEFELYGMGLASEAGLPVPKILDTGTLETEKECRPWFAME